MQVRFLKRALPVMLMAVVASACRQPVYVTLVPSPTPVPPTATSTPFKTVIEVPTPTPVANPQVDFSGVTFFYDPALGGAYGSVVPEDDDSSGSPDWQLPARMRFTAVEYPLPKSTQQVLIQVIPIDTLVALNPTAAQSVETLRTILKDKPARDAITGAMPQLSNLIDAQIFFSQVKYLDFKNGSGVRFISEYSNDVRPINNADMVYQFQGITSDGKYLVAIQLPLSQKDLVSSEDALTNSQADAILNDIGKYVADTAAALDAAGADTFNPKLDLLDQLVASLEVTADVKFDVAATQPPDDASSTDDSDVPDDSTP